MHKLAIFDIDKTIISKDSMFLFLWYGMKKKPLTWFHAIAVVCKTVLYTLKLMKVEDVKASFFYAIRHMEEEDLERFYETVLKKHIFIEAMEELKTKKAEGYHILLVSASPYAYMRFFKKIPYVDEVIGTNLAIEDGRYTNRVEGVNCKGEEKVVRIHNYLKSRSLLIDYDQSCAYSDSLSDMPLFKLVKNRYLINRSYPGMEELRWNRAITSITDI
ncbi:HAD family hydrolase [Paenibacillus sp. 1011MAR3C5]|uniref:HAD family hydrolase n=1 Tax=Paenibacillus sp. 1011MAR3C5 TaxID=1675787 RepID=UPI002175F8D8|nr:HAD family hydrolase [Paenibacillus sp. 1011MAR3C5]